LICLWQLIILFLPAKYDLNQGFSTGALGPLGGHRAVLWGHKQTSLLNICRDTAKPKKKLGIFIDEQGATSVESLWKGAINHERLRTIGLNNSVSLNFFASKAATSIVTVGHSSNDLEIFY